MKKYEEFINEELTSKEDLFIYASKYDDINTIKRLLPLVDVNVQNDYGSTALILSATKGNKEIVKLLLKHPNIDVNIQNNYSTALILASYNVHKEIVEMLIPFLEEDNFVDSFYQKLKDKDFNKIYKEVKEYLGRLKPIYATDIRELIQEIWDLNYYKDSKLLIEISII